MLIGYTPKKPLVLICKIVVDNAKSRWYSSYMDINNIHRDLTATVEVPVKPSVLAHIIKDEHNANYLISTPRTIEYKLMPCAKFLETYSKREGVKPEHERVSHNEKSGTVQIWIRGYGTSNYLIETVETNVVEGVL